MQIRYQEPLLLLICFRSTLPNLHLPKLQLSISVERTKKMVIKKKFTLIANTNTETMKIHWN